MITAQDFINNGFVTSAQTVQDFFNFSAVQNYPSIDKSVLPKPTSQDIEKLNLALQYLQQNPDAEKILKSALQNGVGIVIMDQDSSLYRSQNPNNPDGVIFWNPNQAFELYFSQNNQMVSLGKQSSANVLLHEMIHATDPNYAKSNDLIRKYLTPYSNTHPNYKYYNQAEYLAVTEANRLVSYYHKEPIRPDYSGNSNLVPTNSPLDFNTNIYDNKGKLIENLNQVYDYGTKTVTRTTIDYLKLDQYGQPILTKEVRDLNGKIIPQNTISTTDISQPLAKNASIQDFNNYGFAALLSDNNDSRFAALDSMMASNIGQDAERKSREAVQAYDLEQERIQEVNAVTIRR